jgi:hypothetical protein
MPESVPGPPGHAGHHQQLDDVGGGEDRPRNDPGCHPDGDQSGHDERDVAGERASAPPPGVWRADGVRPHGRLPGRGRRTSRAGRTGPRAPARSAVPPDVREYLHFPPFGPEHLDNSLQHLSGLIGSAK